MVLHSELSDTKIRLEADAPANPPSFVGEVYAEKNSDENVGNCLRVGAAMDSAADFVVVSFVPQGYTGNPNGFVTSRCARDLCIDTSGDALYYAAFEGSTSWTALSGGSGGGGS